jgi:hypothetical protein
VRRPEPVPDWVDGPLAGSRFAVSVGRTILGAGLTVGRGVRVGSGASGVSWPRSAVRARDGGTDGGGRQLPIATAANVAQHAGPPRRHSLSRGVGNSTGL